MGRIGNFQEIMQEKQDTGNTRIVEIIGLYASWLVPLIIYVATIAPCVTAGDAGEFVVAAHRFSLPHAPGYPLYILLLKIWTILPLNFGPDFFAVKCNLFSALLMSLMCWVFYRLARNLTGSAAASLGATMLLAFSRTLWKFAVVTEVYALHLLLIVLVLLGLSIARDGRKPVGLVIAALAFGFGLAHHHTILLLVPLMLFLWPKKKGFFVKPVPVAGIIAGFILPLALYLFLPVLAGNTPMYENRNFTPGDFIDTISRQEFRERADWQDPDVQMVGTADTLTRSLKWVPKQFGGIYIAAPDKEASVMAHMRFFFSKFFRWIIPILCVIGWFFAPPGKRAWGFWCGVTAILWIIAVSFFSRGSPLGMPFNYLRSVDEFLLPVNIFMALGFAWLMAPVSRILTSQKDIGGTEEQNIIPPEFIPVAIMLLLCVIPFFTGRANSRYSNMTHHTFAQDQARNVLVQAPMNGVLVVSGDESFMFEYLREVRNIREDLELVVYPFSIQAGNEMLDPVDSLAVFLSTQLEDRECMFSFGDAAAAVEKLGSARALRLDGIAYTLVDREESEPSFKIGDPNIWTKYQLRNLEEEILDTLVVDDFEYEVFDRYVNGMRASSAWLIDTGFGPDAARYELDILADLLESKRDETDYPKGP
jgi:hypothetical protein